MRVVGISETATLSVPLDILSGLAADFDGDGEARFWLKRSGIMNFHKRTNNSRNQMIA